MKRPAHPSALGSEIRLNDRRTSTGHRQPEDGLVLARVVGETEVRPRIEEAIIFSLATLVATSRGNLVGRSPALPGPAPLQQREVAQASHEPACTWWRAMSTVVARGAPPRPTRTRGCDHPSPRPNGDHRHVHRVGARLGAPAACPTNAASCTVVRNGAALRTAPCRGRPDAAAAVTAPPGHPSPAVATISPAPRSPRPERVYLRLASRGLESAAQHRRRASRGRIPGRAHDAQHRRSPQ